MRVTKKIKALEAERLAALTACVERHGATPGKPWLIGDYTMDTVLGPLDLTVRHDGVSMRFCCGEASWRLTGNRPYKHGKWNLSFYGEHDLTGGQAVEHLEQYFALLAKFVPTDAELTMMVREICEWEEREAHSDTCRKVREMAEADGLRWGVATRQGHYLQPDGSYVPDSYLTCQRFASEADANLNGRGVGGAFKVV